MILTRKERHEMILKTLNDEILTCPVITKEKYEYLLENFNKEELNKDFLYLEKIGLVCGCIVINTFGGKDVDFSSASLTAAGFDYVNIDTIGNDVNSVTVKVHKNTIEQLETIINSTTLPPKDKTKLLTLIKEKGAEKVIGKCLDALVTNAPYATAMFSALLAQTSS